MRRSMLMLAVALAGCGPAADNVGSTASHDAVVQVYNREVQFAQPTACDIFLVQRATDENGRTVEYDGQVNGHAESVVYSIVASDPLPLQVAVYDATGMNAFTVKAADHSLQVLGPDGTLVRAVDGYDDVAAATMTHGTDQALDADGLALLGCALADRRTLGDVPAFLRNLSSGGQVPGQTDVGQSSSNAPPILPDWNGNVSLLGAFWLMSGCLGASDWQCGCYAAIDDPVIGPLTGWCP